MGIRNKKQETLRRLDSKTLDARFLNEIQNWLNCSGFEAEAVLEVVKCSLEHFVKFPSFCINFTYNRTKKLQVANLLDFKEALICHSIHSGLDGTMGPGFTVGQGLLNSPSCTILVFPDYFHNNPFSFVWDGLNRAINVDDTGIIGLFCECR